MQLIGLDENFQTIIGYLPYINLQWERSYYSYGTYTVKIQARLYTPALAYLYTKDRPEVGIVQKVSYRRQLNGKFVELSGFFLKRIVDDKIAYPAFYCNGTLDAEVLRMVSTYKADIPRLVVDAPAGLGRAAEWQDTGGELGAIACARLQEQQLSYYCSYNDQDGKVHFGVWQGKDRTQSQTQNSFAVFSDDFDNIGDVEITVDRSNYKNYGVVAGEGEESERIVEIADASGGGYRRQVWLDRRNARFDPEEQTGTEYRAGLRANGFNVLATRYYIIENTKIALTSSVDLSVGNFGIRPAAMKKSLRYRVDYDLGDLCDVVIHDIALNITARIIFVREVIKGNQHSVELELGDAVLTRTEKARL